MAADEDFRVNSTFGTREAKRVTFRSLLTGTLKSNERLDLSWLSIYRKVDEINGPSSQLPTLKCSIDYHSSSSSSTNSPYPSLRQAPQSSPSPLPYKRNL